MRAKKILLLSHIPVRDEISDMMLATSLTSKDVCVWKYPILGKCREAICLIKPDIIIVPEIRLEFTRDLVKQCKEWGIRVVQKRCEMGISAETTLTDELERCLFGNLDYTSYIDLDLVWGQGFADLLIEHGTPKEKIRVVGGLGFDPYFTPPPVLGKVKETRILFAGGFGYADSSPLYAAPESKPGEKINAELVQTDRENRLIFQDMMAKVMKRFPKHGFGLRPHPGEIYNEYTVALKGYEFASIYEYFTPIAIAWADIIIHPGSTMAYEAHLFNTPTFNFRNTNLDQVVGRIAPLSNTADELIEQLEKVELGKSNANPEVIKGLEKYYGKVDGKANERAAKHIINLKCTETKIPNDWPKDTIKYKTAGVYTDLYEWVCTTCENKFHGQNTRNTVKCPYCGIGCVVRKVLVNTDPVTGETTRTKVGLGTK